MRHAVHTHTRSFTDTGTWIRAHTIQVYHVKRCICTNNQNGQIEQAKKIMLDISQQHQQQGQRAIIKKSLTNATKDGEPNEENGRPDITAMDVV